MNIDPLFPTRSTHMAKAKKRKAKKRANVNRAERVAATPETMAHLAERAKANGGHACPLLAMVYRGDMTPQQHEAALEIWDAYDALTRRLKARGSDYNERGDKAHTNSSDRMEFLISTYLKWSETLMRRYILQASVVVGWIDDSEADARMVNDVQRRMLVKACDTWIDVIGDARRARQADRRVLVT